MEDLYNDSDKQLAPFLRELADSVDSKELEKDQLKCIGEFFMSYKFYEKRNGLDKKEDEEDEEEMDVVKFITMGWWVYTQILKDEKDKKDNNPDPPITDPE
jgi:hypothetical protein